MIPSRRIKMKYLINLSIAAVLIIGMGSVASAQCDPTAQSHIRCGYYNEGYMDGARDAQQGQNDSYQRYRNKYERQYENFYRDGYRAGYASVQGVGRWTTSQRLAYNNGYDQGARDRSSSRSNGPQPQQNASFAVLRPYFVQGYMDGYSNTPRRYDFAVGSEPSTPWPNYPGNQGRGYPGSGGTGSVVWNGRVDNQVRVFIQGSRIWAQDITNSGFQQGAIQWNGSLPRRATTVSVNKQSGRGSAFVVEQPSAANGFTAAIDVSDPQGGAANYRLEMTWQGSSFANPVYSPGRVNWRGRVDDRVNIMISGTEVWEETVSGNPTFGVTFDIQGYLAAGPGTIRANKRNGRGDVQVLQQPSVANGFVGIVQVRDSSGGSDQYEIDITW